MNGAWIETVRGGTFDFTDIPANTINILDVAHALGNLCRFTGHVRRFASIAEHSINVSRVIQPRLALFGLLHDAQEAYTNDINSPLKHLLDRYNDIEAEIQLLVYSQFCKRQPDADECAEINRADRRMLCAEARQLLPSKGSTWENVPITPMREESLVKCWSPEVAAVKFADRFIELTREGE